MYLSYLLPAHSFMEISMYLLFPSLILARTGIQTRIEECEVAGRAPAHSPCSDFQWPCLVAGSSWLAPSLPHPIPIPTSQRSAADLGVMLGMMLKLSWCCQPRRSASLSWLLKRICMPFTISSLATCGRLPVLLQLCAYGMEAAVEF